MKKEPAKSKKTPKWYNSPLNSRIRDLLKDKNIKPDDFANVLGVSTEAVRLWCAGYARPDIDKLLFIANYFNVSVNYLLGQTDSQSTEADIQAIGDYTGLNDEAIQKLHEFEIKKNDDSVYKYSLEFINVFLSHNHTFNLLLEVASYIDSVKMTAYIEKENPHIDFYSYNVLKPIGNSQKEIDRNQEAYIKWRNQKNQAQRLCLFNLNEMFMNLIKMYGNDTEKKFDFDEYHNTFFKDKRTKSKK